MLMEKHLNSRLDASEKIIRCKLEAVNAKFGLMEKLVDGKFDLMNKQIALNHQEERVAWEELRVGQQADPIL